MASDSTPSTPSLLQNECCKLQAPRWPPLLPHYTSAALRVLTARYLPAWDTVHGGWAQGTVSHFHVPAMVLSSMPTIPSASGQTVPGNEVFLNILYRNDLWGWRGQRLEWWASFIIFFNRVEMGSFFRSWEGYIQLFLALSTFNWDQPKMDKVISQPCCNVLCKVRCWLYRYILLLLLIHLFPTVLRFWPRYTPCHSLFFLTLPFKTPQTVKGRGPEAYSGGFVSLLLLKSDTHKATSTNRVNKHRSSGVSGCLELRF